MPHDNPLRDFIRTQNRVINLYERRILQLQGLVREQAELIEWLKDRNEGFYQSPQWLELRTRVLETYGSICMACGATPSEGVRIHVDHIKPMSRFPELCLAFDNLQVLCEACNLGKSNKGMIDWRTTRENARAII